jgi:hypothetical protein
VLPFDAQLNAIKANLTANNHTAAITGLNDFINEVENQRMLGLTGEGHALLKFNAIYLRDQLFNLLPADAISPITTVEVSPTPNEVGWNQTDINITLTAADNSGGSGVKEIHYTLSSNPEVISAGVGVVIPVTAEGETALSYYAVDQAGNNETEKTLTVKIDKTAPVINTSANPPANAAGWSNTDVTVTFLATDSLSGNSTCTPATVTVSTEGADQTVSATCRDQAGNSSSASYRINLDKTPPIVNFGPLSPLPNSAGWNNGDVAIAFSVSDALSGLLATEPASSPLLFQSDGVGMIQSVRVTDRAGNSATYTSPAVNRDSVAPTLTFGAASPLPNAAGWNNTDVSLPFATQDDRSGVAGASVPNPLVLSTEGTAISMSVTVTDQAGNQAIFNTPTFKIDKTAPILTPPSLVASYLLNSTLSLSFTASDALSEISTMGGSLNGTLVSSGATVLLDQIGANSFTLTATDQAGNSANESRAFSVLYGFGGFLPPLNPNSTYQLGRTLPTKFQLTDSNGAAISAAVAHLSLQKLSGTEPTGDPIDASSSSEADSGNLFRFDGSQYIFNLDTQPLSAGFWQLQAVLNDGSTQTIQIGLKVK